MTKAFVFLNITAPNNRGTNDEHNCVYCVAVKFLSAVDDDITFGADSKLLAAQATIRPIATGLLLCSKPRESSCIDIDLLN